MDIKTYLIESEKTLSSGFDADTQIQKLLHGVIGLSTESGELLDALKKHVYYGQPLDEVNLKEEMGDVMWYFAILLRELGLDFENVLDKNIEKLRSRYGGQFDQKKAEKRNLKLERKILES